MDAETPDFVGKSSNLINLISRPEVHTSYNHNLQTIGLLLVFL